MVPPRLFYSIILLLAVETISYFIFIKHAGIRSPNLIDHYYTTGFITDHQIFNVRKLFCPDNKWPGGVMHIN